MTITCTEFYVQTTGSNCNAGSTNADAAAFTYASGTWVAGTGVFTLASGNPLSDGVAVGDFASVYADGSTVTGFVGRVTAVDATTITVSLTVKSGTAPVDGTSNRTVKIGGAWMGPNGAEAFPFNFVSNAMTDASSHPPRVNLKNNAQYDITAAITNSANPGPYFFEGYTATPGDGGFCTIDGGTSGASYALLTFSSNGGVEVGLRHVILAHNGATGSAAGLTYNGRGEVFRCVFTGMRGFGATGAISTNFKECEAYGNNLSNTSNTGGFGIGDYSRCNSHDNEGSNTHGWVSTGGQIQLDDCTSHRNGAHGLSILNGGSNMHSARHCNFYDNGGSGLSVSGSTERCYVENSHFVHNGTTGTGHGVTASHSGTGMIILRNCSFGAGDQANASGTTGGTSTHRLEELDSFNLPAGETPWNDPDNGDFTTVLEEAKGAGRGEFVQTAAGYAGTESYPDIGAAQHQDSGGGGGSTVGHVIGGAV